jgi:cell division protein FtsN
MLRSLILLLIAANAAYYAWTQSWFAPIGWVPSSPREPQRVEQQIQPYAVRVLSTTEARRLETTAAVTTATAAVAAPKSPECLQSTLLTAAQADSLRQALASWPNGSWQLAESVQAGRWLIYMGKYPNAEAVEKKKAELRELGITPQALRVESMQPGISLGSYDSKRAANVAMEGYVKRGLRTGVVVEESPERKGQVLKLPAVDDSLRPQLDALRSTLGEAQLARCTG